MITVRQLVSSELEKRPELYYLLHEDLINISGLARHLKPSVQKQLGEKVSTETVSMAIRRLQSKNRAQGKKALHTPKARNVHIQLDVAILTYSSTIPLSVIANGAHYRFFSFAKGQSESMLAISQEDAPAVRDGAIRFEPNMAALTITLEGETSESTGAYAHIQMILAVAGIPIAEVVSVHDDLTLLVADRYIDRALQILREALKS